MVQPVLLGADMNCYSTARAFHQAYGVSSVAFGRWEMGEIRHSRIVSFTQVQDDDYEKKMLEMLCNYSENEPAKLKILLGCTDEYASLLIRNKAMLKSQYIVPYIDEKLMNTLVSKEHFYQMCRKFDIAYPKTVIIRSADGAEAFASLPFPFPVVIKPSSSILYWKHPFQGMKKVYIAYTAEDALKISEIIFKSGYPDSLIVQDLVPGADDKMRVLTIYCDQNSRVKMACLGHVLLEEHTPKALGNHAAILTEYNRPLMDKFAAFLQDIGYTGFANFDLKYDERDCKYKVFEINLRLGRSNYYLTGAGLNVAEFLVEDRVLGHQDNKAVFFEKETYWHSIPNSTVWRYTSDELLAKKAMALVKQGRHTTSLDYKFDTHLNLPRCLYLWEHYRRYHKKYAKYCKRVR